MNSQAAPDRPLPVLFCLHFLGGSARTWDAVADRLNGVVRLVPLDLPGFGDATDTAGYDVASMADTVAAAIRSAVPRRWLMAGHSMGAKVAAVMARRAEDGEADLAGLAGLILLAGSPPGPEPMEEHQRQQMLGWFGGDAAQSRSEADGYIRKNISRPLDPILHERAVDEVLRAHPAAWRAWLESGSREDWSGRVDRLTTPTLIVAGADDSELGAEMQRQVMGMHFAKSRLMVLPEAAHLLPLECPDRVADLIADHAVGTTSTYGALIWSDRVSRNTRELLLARTVRDESAYQPRAIEPGLMATLRALQSRVLPQTNPAIDLAARIDAQLADGIGDGWRFGHLPPDGMAYNAGLRTFDTAAGASFSDLDAGQQDTLLQRAAAGELAVTGDDLLDAGQMKLWFEDVRSDAVRIYVSHPATLARIGYSGIGYGGDGEPKPGFRDIGPGQREPWEPEPAA